MGTSKQQRKYKTKEQPEVEELVYKVYINNKYFLDRAYESWAEAETAAKKYIRGRNMNFVIVTGV